MQSAERVKGALITDSGASVSPPLAPSAQWRGDHLGGRRGLRGYRRLGEQKRLQERERLRGQRVEGLAQGGGAQAAVEQANPGGPAPAPPR